MSATAQQQCKFFLLRYVPDAVKNEFVNIGLVLVSPDARPELRFTNDWSRVTGLDPQADIELLEALRNELKNELSQEESADLALRMIEESFSNTLQASEYKACLTGAPAQEADDLARIYLEAPRRRASGEKSARQRIWQSMQQAFSETGVWQRMWHDIPVSRYSHPGDPLKIDCGYRTNSTIKMFLAMALKAQITAAKVLAFSYPDLAAGIQRVEGAQTYLTAVIEDNLEKTDPMRFALETLERQQIHVATVSDLSALAQTAAKELRILP